jgi:hypothetical protein
MLKQIARCLVVALVVLAIASPTRVWGWGNEGHIIVARIAEMHLSGKARAGIKDLIGTQSIADRKIALWADNIKKVQFFLKKYPKNPLWHFIDLPADQETPDVAKVCKDTEGACVVVALKRFRGVLADPDASDLTRKEALLFLVHLVGDIHQPLHCADLKDDHGGNLRHVILPGGEIDATHSPKLHEVWDTTLVRDLMDELEPLDFANRLNAEISVAERKEWSKHPDFAAWAREGHALARKHAYDGITAKDGLTKPVTVSEAYVTKGKEVVSEQLKKAGIRLAVVLNEAFE